MFEGLFAKFQQNPNLLQRLRNTGNAKLVEDSSKDLYWGGAVEGSINRLGDMLEEIRYKFQNNLI